MKVTVIESINKLVNVYVKVTTKSRFATLRNTPTSKRL